MNNILFLDFDGVLNTDSFRDLFGSQLNPFLVRNLVHLVVEGNFDIVLSTAWRHTMTIERMHQALACQGFREALSDEELSSLNIIGETDKIRGSTPEHCRSIEILSFVSDHDLKHWVAVDDMNLSLPEGHFHKTDPEKGLQMKDVEHILKMIFA